MKAADASDLCQTLVKSKQVFTATRRAPSARLDVLGGLILTVATVADAFEVGLKNTLYKALLFPNFGYVYINYSTNNKNIQPAIEGNRINMQNI